MDDPLFWAKVNKDGPTLRPELGPCWEWTGYRARGYGVMRRASLYRFQIATHRYSWMLANGPIPDGLLVCHRCDNPPCVRPDHLFLGTTADNTRDRDAKGRGRHPEHRWLTCKRGHPLTPDNRIGRGRWTSCRTCHNARNRAYRAHGVCT